MEWLRSRMMRPRGPEGKGKQICSRKNLAGGITRRLISDISFASALSFSTSPKRGPNANRNCLSPSLFFEPLRTSKLPSTAGRNERPPVSSPAQTARGGNRRRLESRLRARPDSTVESPPPPRYRLTSFQSFKLAFRLRTRVPFSFEFASWGNLTQRKKRQ